MANAALQGDYLMNELRKLQQSHECMGDVRGKGLMVGVELVKDRETKVPAKECRDKIINAAFRKGLLLLGCGENNIRFCPALTVSRTEINTCLTIFDDVVRETACC
jgi:4-aminobutyrate aminotransferase